ncbi:MAG: hypothetical protein J7L69_03910 [Desulfobulbaceae bacterium]|nr:hypothetical protein [Desulfobulbaceae bacterium]
MKIFSVCVFSLKNGFFNEVSNTELFSLRAFLPDASISLNTALIKDEYTADQDVVHGISRWDIFL